MLEVCHTIAICIDRNRMFANRLNVEYTLDLAVRNVERLNVSSFVMGVHMSELLIFHIMDFAYLLTWVTQTSHGKCLFVWCFILQLGCIKRSKMRNVTGLHRNIYQRNVQKHEQINFKVNCRNSEKKIV